VPAVLTQGEVGCGCGEHCTVCTDESVPGPVEASTRRSACCRWHVPAATAPSVRWGDVHGDVCTGESVPGPMEASTRRSACCRWHVPAATAPSVRWGDVHGDVCTGESVPGPMEASTRRSACCRWHVPAATAPSVRWDVGRCTWWGCCVHGECVGLGRTGVGGRRAHPDCAAYAGNGAPTWRWW
jgi:hypothetical protein